MFTGTFWRQVLERLVKTFAQTFAAAALLGEPGTSVFAIDWQGAAGIALAAALGSLLTSLVSAPVGQPASPSAVDIESAPVTTADRARWQPTE